MEHVQEFWPQRRPMRSRPQATIAQRKGIFTFLSEGTFTKLPDNNIINLYQVSIFRKISVRYFPEIVKKRSDRST